MKQVEILESRRLMADISVVAAGNTILNPFTAGAKLKPVQASYTVASTGTLSKTEAKAKLVLTVALRPAAGGADVAVGTAKISASSLAKKAATAKVTFSKLKVAPAAGSYSLVATLTGQSVAGDTNAANDSAASAVTVAAGSTGTGTGGSTTGSPLAAIGLGPTIVYKKVAFVGRGTVGVEEGTWSDAVSGKSGIYTFTRSNSAVTGLFAMQIGGTIKPTLTNGTPLLLGQLDLTKGGTFAKTYTFSLTQPAGSAGFVNVSGSTVYFK